MRVFSSSLFDPYANLALESCLLEAWRPGESWLFLWRNDPCVVVGHFQNPWRECDVPFLRRKGIPLLRRISGGGAVYQDRGNVCFSFIQSPRDFDPRRNLSRVIQAAAPLGVPLRANERHDLLLGQAKVSGSAFKRRRDRCLHHGTLLVRAELSTLAKCLRQRGGFEGQGIRSHPSAVANLSEQRPDLNPRDLMGALAGKASPTELSGEGFSGFAAHRGKLASWEWTYGKTPRFCQKLSLGGLKVRLDVHHGRIGRVKLDSEHLLPQGIRLLPLHLRRRRCHPDGVHAALQRTLALAPWAAPSLRKFGVHLAGSL